MGILFLGGMRARLFAILIVLLLAAFAVLIIVSPYRRDRIFGFMDPWADAFGRGYQLSHALIAFGRGESSASASAHPSRNCSTCPRRIPISCSR